MNEVTGMRVLVVGGAGFLGRNTVDRLRKELPGSVITALDRVGGSRTDLQVDLLDRQATLDALSDSARYDWVLNYAALSYVPLSYSQPTSYLENNVVSMQNLLDALSGGGFRGHLLHFSSCEVYGDADRPSVDSLLLPKSPYAASKAGQELVLHAHYAWAEGAYLASIFRLYNVYGRGQQPNRLIPALVRTIEDGGRFTISGGGEQVRTFLHVDDLMDLLSSVILLRSCQQGGVRVRNIAGLDVLSVNDVVRLAERSRPFEKETGPSTPGALHVSVGDSSGEYAEFRWKPVRRVAAYIRDQLTSSLVSS